ncbi:hypothetical protein L484_006913 [Morus notabilis]|uniref:Ppx/GppA phosphatase N-terminal domain-containing protein n=1 Tax=Morus notabilis TaxID=981085 RepID=W9RYU6_9ROSA|nr:hypothetical protein L484_006913 [Morus notabilis]
MERKSMAFLNLIKKRKSMASSSSAILPPTPSSPSSLFAAIDMGTNSFKLLIVRAHPTGYFLPLLCRKDFVLGRRHYHQTPTSPFAISAFSELRALKALNTFQTLSRAHNIPTTHTRCVATSAVRETANKSEFLENVREKTGLEVEVLSGEEKARLVYLGTLQFFPVFVKLVLCVDIGGGGASQERGASQRRRWRAVGEDGGGPASSPS